MVWLVPEHHSVDHPRPPFLVGQPPSRVAGHAGWWRCAIRCMQAPRMRITPVFALFQLVSMFVCAAVQAQLDAGLPAYAADAAAPEAAVVSDGSAAAVDGASADASSDDYGAVATATRLARPARLVAASVSVIPRQELDLSPNLTTDAVLRSVPSVATFR